MEEKTNVIVFEKKEIALIFIFLVAISATFLALGYRFGYQEGTKKVAQIEQQLKQLSIEEREVLLKSSDEEEADSIVDDLDLESMKAGERDGSDDDLEKLKAEFEELEQSDPEKKKQQTRKAKKESQRKQNLSSSRELPQQLSSGLETSSPQEASARGRYTIQLGAYNDLDDAKLFASAFAQKGHNPIINEVEIDDAVWYRVSLGMFSTVQEAKHYIAKQSDLFQGQRDYFITTIE